MKRIFDGGVLKSLFRGDLGKGKKFGNFHILAWDSKFPIPFKIHSPTLYRIVENPFNVLESHIDETC